MAENNPLDSGTAASPEPGSQEELDNAVREVGYDGSGDGRLPDLLREAGYDTSLWEPEPEYEANRYNDYIADQVIPDDTPRAPSAGWNEVLIRSLIQKANDTPAWAADAVELFKLRDNASLGLAELHDLEWHAGNRDYDEPGHREQAVLDILNENYTDGNFDVVDAGEIVDYAHATNILRLIDEDRSTNYLDSVEAHRRVDFILNRTGKNPIPRPYGLDPGPVWDGPQIVRLIDAANTIPAPLAGIVETHNLRDADWLELPGIEDEWWFAGSALPGEDSDYGKQEEAMLEGVNNISDGTVDAVDAAHLVDYASATNILREIDKAQGTNYLHSVESYRQAAIARNRSVEADSGISADSAVQETVQPTTEIGNDPDSGLPPADDPFVAREFRLDQFDLSADDRDVEPESADSEPSLISTVWDPARQENVSTTFDVTRGERVELDQDLGYTDNNGVYKLYYEQGNSFVLEEPDYDAQIQAAENRVEQEATADVDAALFVADDAAHAIIADTPAEIVTLADRLELSSDPKFTGQLLLDLQKQLADRESGLELNELSEHITAKAEQELGEAIDADTARKAAEFAQATVYSQGSEAYFRTADPRNGFPPDLAADGFRANGGEQQAGPDSPALDKDAGREVPVDSGVRVDPIAAGTARPGAQSVPQPDQRVHDIASWLHNANLRARAGEAVKPPKPIKEVLGHFKSAPIDQTRIQILAAAAAARTLEGEQSANAQRLNKLVVETQTRLNAIRDHERRTAALEHREKETPREKIAEWDQKRIDRESANDRNVFNAAAAVAAGYVAARGLPAHDQLAQLADEQLGPLPEAPAPEPDKTPQPEKQSGPSKAGQIKNVLDSAGRGLAQAVGPVVGDDEVAPNLSPVNLAQVTEEFAQLAASIAPAMKAAMGSHPRSVKELLNIVQTPDEESDLAFDQDAHLRREAEYATEQSV